MKLVAKIFAILFSALTLFSAQAASADVNDFSFESFDAVYDLSVNAEADNRPEMRVTETLVALFPDTDQNRGIKRSIPSKSYGINPGLIQVESVVDESGKPRDFEVVQEDGFTNIVIKDSDDSFVHGRQVYVISYVQSWIIRGFESTSANDEFYWDINGTGWQQSFGRVSATITMSAQFRENLLLDNVSCYQGLAGSTQSCSEKQLSQDRMSFAAMNLAPGENLTVAIPFRSGALNTVGPRVEGTVAMFLYQVAAGALVLVLAWAIYFRIFGNRTSKSTIVPEYLPAKSPSLIETGIIASKTSHLTQAMIVELAIKKLIEIQPGDRAGDDFLLRRIGSGDEDSAHLAALGFTQVGSTIRIGRFASDDENAAFAKSVAEVIASNSKKVNAGGYFQKRALGLPALVFLFALGVFACWIAAALQLDQITDAGYVAAPILSFLIFSVSYWLLVAKPRFSSKGIAVNTHLKGLEMYIELAEKDRLEFLQSPKGALLTTSEIAGNQVLKLYEEVLPWAIMLGLQEQWGKVLIAKYEQQAAPAFILGSSSISNSLSNLSQSLNTSLATSSTGGSSGGGSSGGGGGGGGGSGV